MLIEQRKGNGKPVFVISRPKTPEELEKEDLLLRIEALEREMTQQNPSFKVPDPPKGLKRQQVSKLQ